MGFGGWIKRVRFGTKWVGENWKSRRKLFFRKSGNPESALIILKNLFWILRFKLGIYFYALIYGTCNINYSWKCIYCALLINEICTQMHLNLPKYALHALKKMHLWWACVSFARLIILGRNFHFLNLNWKKTNYIVRYFRGRSIWIRQFCKYWFFAKFVQQNAFFLKKKTDAGSASEEGYFGT